MDDNVILVKTEDFAVEVVNLCQQLHKQKEYVLSKQLIRSGTSIGANVREAQHAQSKADFVSKMSVALKEANETEYWLILLHRTNYISDSAYNQIRNECVEILKILISIVKNAKDDSNDGSLHK